MGNKFRPMRTKTSDDGAVITIFRDLHHGWFVGKQGDRAYEPQPLGAFKSEDAARAWADQHFEGGQWE